MTSFSKSSVLPAADKIFHHCGRHTSDFALDSFLHMRVKSAMFMLFEMDYNPSTPVVLRTWKRSIEIDQDRGT